MLVEKQVGSEVNEVLFFLIETSHFGFYSGHGSVTDSTPLTPF
jgi:hypothetical protein